MNRVLTAIVAAAVMAASQAAAALNPAALNPADRAGSTQHQASSPMMGMNMTGDAGGWVLFLALLLIIGVAIEGNNHNDGPTSP